MFFTKIFSRGYKSCREKGDSLFSQERFADARVYYLEAIEKVDTASDRNAEYDYLADRLSVTGNRLAEMNIAEAESALRVDNILKAREHLTLSLELADDVTIREKAELLLAVNSNIDLNTITTPVTENKASCSGCSAVDTVNTASTVSLAEIMDSEQQFQLLVNTLPYPLSKRYETMGREFASAYLLAHDDQHETACSLFKELLTENENDIILYELALLEYRAGNRDDCEKYLDRAVKLNNSNSLCHITLAQLYAESGRYPEAVLKLKFMIDHEFFVDQASVMLGDIYIAQGETEAAMEIFSRGLHIPAQKKISAERLVSALYSLNRSEEASFIAKTYLKGCC